MARSAILLTVIKNHQIIEVLDFNKFQAKLKSQCTIDQIIEVLLDQVSRDHLRFAEHQSSGIII